MLLIISILLFVLCVSSYKFTTKINSITYDYEIPNWVYERKIFKKNLSLKVRNKHQQQLQMD